MNGSTDASEAVRARGAIGVLALSVGESVPELWRFAVVGAVGYGVNLAVYAGALSLQASIFLAAVWAFGGAVTSNYALNRVWTFRARRGHLVQQGVRFLLVSALALGANLALLAPLLAAGLSKLAAQAAAIVLVTPVSFLGNRLWTFKP